MEGKIERMFPAFYPIEVVGIIKFDGRRGVPETIALNQRSLKILSHLKMLAEMLFGSQVEEPQGSSSGGRWQVAGLNMIGLQGSFNLQTDRI